MKNSNNSIDPAIIDDLQKHLEDMALIFNLEQDVHQHTLFLGNKCKLFLQRDEEHGIAKISKDLSLPNICESMITIARANGFSEKIIQALTKVLNTIVKHPGIEPETGLNTQELFLKCWILANRMPSKDMILYLIDNLQQNLQEEGGCLAGITARLTLPYCILLIDNLQQSLELKILVGNTVDSNNPEDLALSEEQQLKLALQASEADALNEAILFSSKQDQEKQTNLQEEFEVQQAMAASLQAQDQSSNHQKATADALSITSVWEQVKQATHLDPEEKQSIALALAVEASIKAASEQDQMFARSSSSYKYR